jgi:hypothetical protein
MSIETRPAVHARTKSRATLNGIPLTIVNLDPIRFARLLRERRRKRDPRRERLERAEQALKAAVHK